MLSEMHHYIGTRASNKHILVIYDGEVLLRYGTPSL